MYRKELEIADLKFWIKIYRDKVERFESGEKYNQMLEEFERCRRSDARKIRRLEKELAAAREEVKHVRDLWFDICDELEKSNKKLAEQVKEEHKKFLEKSKELYALKTEFEREKEKRKKLHSMLKKDHKNSSKPSSMNPNHDTIHNTREKTEKSPGAQPGHEHHGRKKHAPTTKILIPPPAEFLDEDKYKPTGRTITRQLVKVHLAVETIEFSTQEFRDRATRQKVHAAFPDGVINDVNYDGSVKALAYMINNGLYTSIDKTRDFLKDVSHGELALSNGFICNLAREFSEKTESEREDIFKELVSAPVLHADFTFGRTAGKQNAVIITTANGKVLYQARKKKGDEGVKGSPLEFYDGILVSDHEAALIKHGMLHQECLAHVLRYAIAGMETEPGKTWHGKLADWIGRSVDYWGKVAGGREKKCKKKTQEFIDELRMILELAEREYEYEPPSRYFREGYNTFKRIREEFDDYVLFLKDFAVDPTNNVAERLARKYKRKAHQVMTFRSMNGTIYFCDGLSVMETLKAEGENIFDALTQRFNMT